MVVLVNGKGQDTGQCLDLCNDVKWECCVWKYCRMTTVKERNDRRGKFYSVQTILTMRSIEQQYCRHIGRLPLFVLRIIYSELTCRWCQPTCFSLQTSTLPPSHVYGHANDARSPARGMALIKYEAEFTQQFSISKKLVHNKDMTTLSI